MRGVVCCGESGRVFDSRQMEVGGVTVVWRRRKCPVCGEKWTTGELDWDIVKEVLSDDSDD